MKTTQIILAVLCTLAAATATPQVSSVINSAAERIRGDCRQELDTHCSTVTAGEGRVFACLYAYSDKLSGRCEYALYESGQELEYLISRLSYLADACASDATRYCAEVKAGEGRLVECLNRNKNKLTPACQQAIQTTGITTK